MSNDRRAGNRYVTTQGRAGGPAGGVRPARRSVQSRILRTIATLAVLLFVICGLGLASQVAQETAEFVTGLVRRTGMAVPGADDPGQVWRGTERVNVLLMGLDRRDDESEDLARTDSMLIVSIDPQTKSAGVLSLPRDLWVQIPLSDKRVVEDRINAAFVYGTTTSYPGGGPALAKKTVERNFGIRVHYAAWADFSGFVRVVDALGGLTIDVESPLKDNEYPTEDYRTKRIYFESGLQHMSGEAALMYARSRHQDSDIARASRQQQVLVAARNQALKLDLLPKLPKLLVEFRSAVKTDLAPADVVRLARLGNDVDLKRVTVRTVPSSPTITVNGADVMVMDKKLLPKVLGEVFGLPNQAKEEPASVEVLNGTSINGLAGRTAGYLKDRGLQVVRFDSADESDRKETTIYASSSTQQTALRIADLLGLTSDRIHDRLPDQKTSADVRVILGKDAKIPPDR